MSNDQEEKIVHSGPEYVHTQNSYSEPQPQQQQQPYPLQPQQPQQQLQHQNTVSSSYVSSPSVVSTSTPLHHQPSGISNGTANGSEAQFLYPQVTPSEAQYQYPQVTSPGDSNLPEVSRSFTSPPPQQNTFINPQQRQFTNPQIMAHPPLQPTAYGQQGGEWQASLCDCSPCSSCLLGWCLPCILVGQTSERIRDPSMQNADLLNSDCLIHGAITCFTGCGWIYALLKRGEIRERYNIQGSGCSDCCVSFWCSCCAVIQQDNEVKIRQQNAAAAGPVQQGYQPQPGMQMPPTPAATYQQPAEK